MRTIVRNTARQRAVMFGRNPRLRIDVHFGIENTTEAKAYSVYVDDLRKRLICF